MGELAEERRALAHALEQLGFSVRWFEQLGGRDDDAGQAYLSEVRSSTLYVGLLSDQYGAMLSAEPYAGFSATHAEYLEARAHGKRISFWARQPADQRDGHARQFLTEVQLFHVTGSFSGAEDLVDASSGHHRPRYASPGHVSRPGATGSRLRQPGASRAGGAGRQRDP